MKKLLCGLIIVIILVNLIVVSCFSYLKSENYLWKNTISKYMKYDLWDDINSYDAGHSLLVPMYYAFSKNDQSKIDEFHELFVRYTEYLTKNNYEYEYWNLNHMQFNFLASNYLNLCNKYDKVEKIPKELINYLYDENFFYSFIKREKYNQSKNPNYNALVAIERDIRLKKPIADLYQYHCILILNLKEFSNNSYYKISEPREKVVEDTLNLLDRIYTEGVTFISENKWLISVGAFDKNEDYAYMHYDSIETNMQPHTQENTTWDSSHFARVPVFLQILKRAHKEDKDQFQYYDKLINGLKEQFIDIVLIEPNDDYNYYRTTNYMDGRNGLYRYNYKTQENTGYLPYQLSGTICLDWWTFLGGEVPELYKDIYKTFPLSKEAIATYVGQNTTRERNQYVTWPNYFENGFAELECLLASKMEIEEILK